MRKNDSIIIYKELLEDGPYPKSYREERNKKFLEALPKWMPKDLADWMCKKYIDREPCEIRVEIGDPIKNRVGMVQCYIKASVVDTNITNERLFIQTPLMRAPFGITTDHLSDPPRYTLALNIDESSRTHQTFHKNINYIDAIVKKKIMENCEMCLRKKRVPQEMMNELYHSRIKISRDRETGEPDGKFPPMFNLSLKPNNRCLYFNDKKEKISFIQFIEQVKRGYKIQGLVQVVSVWISNRMCGVIYSPAQLRYEKSFEQQIQSEYMFDDSE